MAERLWCTPPHAPVGDAARTALADGAAGTVVGDGDGALAVWRWGSAGPLVLLAHGWGGHAGQWAAFVRPLVAAGFRVLAFDAPGHGRSAAGALGPGRATLLDFQWALRLLAAREGQPYAVVAHSLGATAAALALPRGDLMNRPDEHALTESLTPDPAPHASSGAFAPERAVFLAPAASPARYAAQFGRALGLSTVVARRWQQRLATRLAFDWGELDMCGAPARGHTPTLLVVHDCGDRSIPWTDGAAVAACWPRASLHTTEALGHRRLLTDPAVIARAVAFLAR